MLEPSNHCCQSNGVVRNDMNPGYTPAGTHSLFTFMSLSDIGAMAYASWFPSSLGAWKNP